MSRLDRLAATLDGSLVVTKGSNVRYLTGFSSTNAALLVEPSGETTLYTDFRYATAAQAVPDVSFVRTERDVIAGLAKLLGSRQVGFEAEHLSYASTERLRSGGAQLVPTSGCVERVRAVKEPAEIAAIRAACAISDAVYGDIAQHGLGGHTERAIARFIELRFLERGAQGLAFPSIVASALHGAQPHVAPQDVEIPSGTLVTLDLGCVVDGYCSDCTRTFATGPLPEALAAAYALCATAQTDGLAAVRAGARASEVDAASRVAIAAAGFADAFGHGLGHGVGIEVHEMPTLRRESVDVLEIDNVVSVGPGLYLEGVGGVRIEDLVAVTAAGCDILTGFPKTLLTVA